jgi:hypothetical protein
MINQQCALNMHMLLKVVDQEIDLLPPENSGITETKTFTSKGAFACNQCIFKTNQEMRLQSHTKVHEVLKHYPHKKSYVCECGFLSLYRRSYDNHRDVHDKNKKYMCPIEKCGKKVRTVKTLNEHLKKKHNVSNIKALK